MSYKILHFADLHLEAAFAGQGFPVEYGIERRLDLRAALTRILARARELKVDALTIGGDLFVQTYLLPETADFIQQQFALLAPIQVIIAPGKLDPYTNESPYAQLNWPENVDIFYQGKLTQLELAPNIHLWGACNPPMRGHKLFNGFKAAEGINILLLHAQQQPTSPDIHTISEDEVRKAGFELTLLGGRHGATAIPTESPRFVIPGSPEPLSPEDEDEPHQVTLVEIEGNQISLKPIHINQWHYRTFAVNMSDCSSLAETASKIDNVLDAEISGTQHCAVTIALTGKPDFELSPAGLRQLIQSAVYYRLESRLGFSYDLEQLAREQTVRGFLVQRFLDRIQNAKTESEREKQLTALHFALQALDGKRVSLYETKAN